MAGETLFDKIERLALTLERMQMDKYLQFVSDKKRMLFMAFLGGTARGVGFMFGFSTVTSQNLFDHGISFYVKIKIFTLILLSLSRADL